MNFKKLILIPALAIAFAATAQEADMTMKPVAKSKYNVDIEMQMDLVQTVQGMEMKVNSNSTGKAVMVIESVADNGDFTVLTEWKNLRAHSSAMGQDTTMNFDDLNLKMRTVYDQTGTIIKNELVDSVSSQNPAAAMIEQMATGMKFHILPAKKVKKGETWNSKTSEDMQPAGSPLAMKIESDQSLTYTGNETKNGNEYHRITASGPITITGEGTQMGMNMSVEGTGMNEGFSLLDKASRMPMYTEVKLGLDMNIMVAGPQTMAIPMTQNMLSTITLTEVK